MSWDRQNSSQILSEEELKKLFAQAQNIVFRSTYYHHHQNEIISAVHVLNDLMRTHEASDPKIQQLFLAACELAHPDILQGFFTYHEDPETHDLKGHVLIREARNDKECHALACAICSIHFEDKADRIRVLLENGALEIMNLPTPDGMLPLDLAQKLQSPLRVLKMLRDNGAAEKKFNRGQSTIQMDMLEDIA
jgi:hypothetical protein